MSEAVPQVRERYQETSTRVINGHTVHVFEANPAKVNALSEQVASTPLTDEKIRGTIEEFLGFLRLPIIEDDFGADHDARTAWRNEIRAQGQNAEYAFLDTNALRGNSLSVLSRFETIKVFVEQLGMHPVTNGENPAHLLELVSLGMKLQQKMAAEYEAMDMSARKRFVSQVSEVLELAVQGLLVLFRKSEFIQARAA